MSEQFAGAMSLSGLRKIGKIGEDYASSFVINLTESKVTFLCLEAF